MLLHRQGNWGTETLNGFLRVTQLVSRRCGISVWEHRLESGFFSSEIHHISSSSSYSAPASAADTVGTCYQRDPYYFCIISYDDTVFTAATLPMLLWVCNTIAADSACIIIIANNSTTSAISCWLLPAPPIFLPCSLPNLPVFIALVLDLLPCLLLTLFTDGELRLRARKCFIYYSHEVWEAAARDFRTGLFISSSIPLSNWYEELATEPVST